VVCEGGERVRLLLVDTPEMSQAPFGPQAKRALQELLPVGTRARLELDVQERDRYGRVLAYIYLPDGRMANEEMARQGYAFSLTYPPNVRHVERIRAALEEARAARRGLWSTRAFECSPQDYRAGRCT
jgi:micrococcal nuclease